jgi:hypothetical protein
VCRAQYVAKNFFTGCIDKAKGQPFSLCKRCALQLVAHHMSSSPAFIIVPNADYSQLSALISRKIPSFFLPPMQKIPTLYPIGKIHKTPIRFRFISSTAGCYTSQYTKVLHTALWQIFEHMRIAAHTVAKLYHCHYGQLIRLDTVLCDPLQAAINLPTRPTEWTSFANLRHYQML